MGMRSAAGRWGVTFKLTIVLGMDHTPRAVTVLLMLEGTIKGFVDVAQIKGTHRRTMNAVSNGGKGEREREKYIIFYVGK